MATNNRPLKAYVRFDGSGRIVAGSLILRKNKPKVGKWQEIPAFECCNPPVVTFNFDVTADWSLSTPAVTSPATFKTFLESGEDGDGNTNNLTGVVVTDFLLVGNRLRCNVSSTGGGDLGLAYMGVTDVTSFGNLQMTGYLYLYGNSISSVDNTSWPIGVTSIDVGNNNITSFDNVTWPSSLNDYLGLYSNPFTSFNPSVALPSGILTINLGDSQLASFDPTLPLPSSLQYLYIYTTQITTFDPSIALPSGLQDLHLYGNQVAMNFTPSLPLPSSLINLYLYNSNIVTFDPAYDLPSGLTQLNLSNNQIVNFTPSNSLGSSLQYLYLQDNQIVNFDPGVALPSSLIELYLANNQIVTFNPTITLPNLLQVLSLSSNQIVNFNPTLPLPSGLLTLDLTSNQMTTAGYTASEPWANAMSVIPGRGYVYTSANINSVSGTNLETILIAKGWTVSA